MPPRRDRPSLFRGALAGGAFACVLSGCLRTGAGASSPPSPVDAPAGDAERTCAENPTVPEPSTFFASAVVENRDSIDLPSDGDLWPSCSSADRLYTAWGDGFGFQARHEGVRPDIGVAVVVGSPSDPASVRGTNLVSDGHQRQSDFRVWTTGPYYQKPTGMLCRGEKLYLAVQDLNSATYDDVPAATVAVSDDGGTTWTEGATPMFTGAVFTTIMFLDFGKDGESAVDSYVYAYGLDHNWRTSRHVIDPQGLYLARIPAKQSLVNRKNWEFFAGRDATGSPTWSPRIVDKRAVLVDCTRRRHPERSRGDSVIAQGGVLYDAPLKRFLYTSWSEDTFEFYEAPAPWGPWRRFLAKNFGAPPWTPESHGGYATSAPSRYVSADGKILWIQSNTWSSGVAHNNFALRRLVLDPR